MASLNKVFLMGNLTRPPELRYTPGGTPVADRVQFMGRGKAAVPAESEPVEESPPSDEEVPF